jgi:hypothetical protein
MKKFLMIFGAVPLVIVAVAAVGIGVAAYRGTALDAESKAFVDASVPAIASGWNKQELLDRGTPELREMAKPEQLAAMFDTLARFGPLVKYEGAEGDATMAYTGGSGSTVSATYVAKARFQNGDALFRIALIKRDGRWMIHNFHVDPASVEKRI